MFIIALFLAFAGIIILATCGKENGRIREGVAIIGGMCIIISVIIMYSAGLYSNAAEEGVEYTFVSRIDEEVVVYQSYDRAINPQNKRVVKIITKKDLQPGIQPGDTVVLTDNGIKKVLPREEKSSTR